jgi:predicted nucleic acid-binding protein
VARPDLALLDTDVWSHLYGLGHRRHPDIARWRELLAGRTVLVAVQTRAEVLMGLLRLGEARRGPILHELNNTPTVPVNEDVIQRYAQLTADARERGDALWHKIHTGDRWIAATALVVDAPLLTGDGIFRSDPDLVLLDSMGDPHH